MKKIKIIVFLVSALLCANVFGQDTDTISSLLSRAEAGDALAQYELGLCYLAEGEEQDLSQAVLWLRKAAEAGVAGAQYDLGIAYQYGEAIPEDANEAVKWWRKATEQGHPKALFNMGWCYFHEYGVPFNPDEGIKYFRCAAAQGDEGALEYILNQIMAGFPMKLD